MVSSTARGYDGPYRRLRKEWAAVVEQGHAWCSEPRCVMPSRWIAPGSEWHLAHSPDRQRIIGPAHAKCNLSEAGRRGNPKGLAKPRRNRPWRPSRRW
jgi:hypothetical protein